MSALSDIQSEIAALLPHLRSEVLHFVQSVKLRLGLPTMPADVPLAAESDDSTLFLALDAAGFVGCIETDDPLSTTYKSRLDFSDK